MSVRNLDKMFHPASVALIGATARPGSVGAVLLRNLLRGGPQRPPLLINPKHQTLDGLPVYPDVASLPATPDLAIIATPPATVPGIVAALGERGTRAAIVITATFAELGERGRALEQAMLTAARPYLLRIIGPDCVGIAVPAIGLDASFSHLMPAAGDLAFVSQSGSMITAVLDWATPRGIGFSHVVSLGGMADVDSGDMLDYLAADAETRAILLYVEAVKSARKFMSAARAAARTKPVLVVKVGRFAEAAGREARADEDAVYDAAFRRAGMLRVDSMAELFDAVETLALTRPQHGDRLVILGNDGGLGALAGDALLGAGGRLAALSLETTARLDGVLPRRWSRTNPIDMTGDAPGKRYAQAIEILLDEPSLDALLVLNTPTALSRPSEVAAAVAATLAAQPSSRLVGRNILTAWLGERSVHAARRRFARARIPTYDTPDSAVRGFMHRVQYRRNQELLMETPAARDDFAPDLASARAAIARARGAGHDSLDEAGAIAFLAAYGIRTLRATAAAPNTLLLRFGILDDPVFGPVVMFGEGGGAASPRDASFELPPLNDALARAQIARTRIGRRMDDNADVAVVAETLIRVSQMAIDHAEIGALEIDAQLAAHEIAAAEMRLRIAPAHAGAARLAISPYPKELESRERLRDGTALLLRPVRPEDEPALQDVAQHMNPDDLRLRFFTPMKRLPHVLAARLSQIDYDREMAILARSDESAPVLGVARFSADPDNRRAEFAVALRSDWKGRGLGYLLMNRLIDVARRRGIAEIIGDVLHENEPMLKLARRLGFTLANHPEDRELVRVVKTLDT
jgi:acetyltransferase